MTEALREWTQKAHAFEKEAKQLLAKHESSRHRVITVDNTLKRLSGLSLKQHELFKQALDCIGYELNRAAHVMAWAAFMDFLEVRLASDGLIQVKSVHSDWSKFKTIEDVREKRPEYQIITAAEKAGAITRNQKKALHGLLSTRNDCAHPSSHDPDLSETLGYIASLLNRIAAIEKKPYP